MSALTDYFSSLANKFRSKTGKSDTLTPNQMVTEVDAVYQKGYDDATPVTQTKSATVRYAAQTITPDTGKLLSSVSLGAIPIKDFIDAHMTSRPGTAYYTHSGDQIAYSSTGYINFASLINSTGYWLVIGVAGSLAVATWDDSAASAMIVESSVTVSGTEHYSIAIILKVLDLAKLPSCRMRFLYGAGLASATDKKVTSLKLCDL